MNKPPWSNEKLKKLGKCIVREEEAPPGLPAYDDVMAYFNDVAADTQRRIEELDWDSLLNGRHYEVTSRPKTIDTLRQKLVRDPATGLQNIQDVAGVRFEAEMTLDEQDAVVTAIVGLFDHDVESSVRDLRSNPHSGYRAVHIWLRLPVRVEVQVRTHLQSEWANMYESLADVMGREIRYDELPSDPRKRSMVEALHSLSAVNISGLEVWKNTELGGADELTKWAISIENMNRENRRRATPRYRKALAAFEEAVAKGQDLEATIRNGLQEHKEMFDNMRSNGRK